MKNLKFFLFPVFCLLAGLFVANMAHAKTANTTADSLTLDAFKIKAEITFGKPPKCEGWGLCKLTIECCSGQMNPGVGVGELEAEKGRLAINYLKNSMTDETLQRHFGSGTFVVDGPYTLSNELTEMLGLKAGYTIQPGKYKIVDNGEKLKVVY